MPDDIQDVLNNIRERLVRIETKIDDYTKLREKIDETYNTSVSTERRVSRIEDGQKWLWRSFFGALIVGFVGAIIKFKIGG